VRVPAEASGFSAREKASSRESCHGAVDLDDIIENEGQGLGLARVAEQPADEVLVCVGLGRRSRTSLMA
jgi:hypothetical protein